MNTLEEKTVAEYANISIPDVYELDIFSFWALLHDAVIYNRSKTKQGRQWLKNAWRLTQTEPDDEAIAQEISKRGGKSRGK